MVKEIVDSSHNVVMITGDNPLTACHVAKVLRFTKKNLAALVLDEPKGTFILSVLFALCGIIGHRLIDLCYRSFLDYS